MCRDRPAKLHTEVGHGVSWLSEQIHRRGSLEIVTVILEHWWQGGLVVSSNYTTAAKYATGVLATARGCRVRLQQVICAQVFEGVREIEAAQCSHIVSGKE